MDITYQHPPDLFRLLVDALPLLCRSKKDVLTFFKGAGVPNDLMQDLQEQVNRDPTVVRKYEMVRTVLERLNERGEATLRERRGLLKRATDIEDFSICWEAISTKPRGLSPKSDASST